VSIYRCKIRGQYNATFGWSTRFLCTTTVAESTVASTLQSAWNSFWTTATNGYTNFASSGVTCTFAEAATLNPSLRLLTKTSLPLSLAGTAAGSGLPLYVSPLICFTGAQDTKSDRGRMHLPAVVSANYTASALLPAFLTSLGIVTQAFWTTMNGLASFQVVSFNRTTNKQGDAPFTQHVLTNWNIPNQPGTARMRVRKQVPTRATVGTT
jgi:hypothetical protein